MKAVSLTVQKFFATLKVRPDKQTDMQTDRHENKQFAPDLRYEDIKTQKHTKTFTNLCHRYDITVIVPLSPSVHPSVRL